MKFETTFSPGDKAYCLNLNSLRIDLLTVGQVRVSHTDSPGIGEETIFSNYQPQHEHEESYMCIESGIGSGTVYHIGKSIFKSHEEAAAARDKYDLLDR